MKFLLVKMHAPIPGSSPTWAWQFVDSLNHPGMATFGFETEEAARQSLTDLLTVFGADIDSVQIEVAE